MKLVDIVNFIPFYDRIKSQKMSALIAYKLSKTYKEVKEEETFYHNKLREILFKYGELDEQGNLVPLEDGSGIKIKSENQIECLREVEELQAIESEISIEPISLSILEGLELTPEEVENFLPFLN